MRVLRRVVISTAPEATPKGEVNYKNTVFFGNKNFINYEMEVQHEGNGKC
jgi:hypothetical protein